MPTIHRLECAHGKGAYAAPCLNCCAVSGVRSVYGLRTILDPHYNGHMPGIIGWFREQEIDPRVARHLFAFPSWSAVLAWFPAVTDHLLPGPVRPDALGYGISTYRVTRRRTRCTLYRCPSGTQVTFAADEATLLARHLFEIDPSYRFPDAERSLFWGPDQ
jgi:hypothetical protein